MPGRQLSSSSAVVSGSRSTACSRTAPLPAQAASPSASSWASGCNQATFSTRSEPARSRTGATQAVCPPGWNGAPTVSDQARQALNGGRQRANHGGAALLFGRRDQVARQRQRFSPGHHGHPLYVRHPW